MQRHGKKRAHQEENEELCFQRQRMDVVRHHTRSTVSLLHRVALGSSEVDHSYNGPMVPQCQFCTFLLECVWREASMKSILSIFILRSSNETIACVCFGSNAMRNITAKRADNERYENNAITKISNVSVTRSGTGIRVTYWKMNTNMQ